MAAVKSSFPSKSITKTVVKSVKVKVEKTITFKYERNTSSKFKFGAHVGMSGGISKAVTNAMDIGANSFALFLKSPRRWISPDIKPEEIEKFKQLCDKYGYDPRKDVLPHGSYFINLGNPDPTKEEQAYGSFLDDLKRCESLNIGLYNFHPGSNLDSDHKLALERLAKNINRAIKETKFVKIVIENMAGHGNLIGSNLQDIRDVIDMVEDKSRVGVCLDTCHSFAAGYDISDESKFNKFLSQFDEIVGPEYLSAIHLNDSKAPLGANRDLHQKLGLGFLGLEVFRVIANCERLQNIPIILETPVEDDDSVYGEEIKLLEWLEDKSIDDKEYITKRDELFKLGAKERDEQLKKYEAKVSKATKRSAKGDIASMVTKKTKTK
ncbi:APN1 [[Candida] subhashii]|uniref:Apurinic-apyrimidinic endonuclease 1 n=1 Tax=[Candida] subhashii TaxID=561895 RepID=A0A8J5QMH8_9ASCO|nr:APN1 [[Candida] subhashii]KAG7665757.1 APN1 [[Candida] subhashii]